MRLGRVVGITLSLFVLCGLEVADAKPLHICTKPSGEMVARKKCRASQFRVDINDIVVGLGNSSCGNCEQNVVGTWEYRFNHTRGGYTSLRTVAFTQSGKAFEGANETDTFSGSMDGSSFSMVQVVTGEWSEGFVRHIQGNTYTIPLGNGFRRMFGYYQDSNGGSGSFVASYVGS